MTVVRDIKELEKALPTNGEWHSIMTPGGDGIGDMRWGDGVVEYKKPWKKEILTSPTVAEAYQELVKYCQSRYDILLKGSKGRILSDQ